MLPYPSRRGTLKSGILNISAARVLDIPDAHKKVKEFILL
jgi:hypothetical protein